MGTEILIIQNGRIIAMNNIDELKNKVDELAKAKKAVLSTLENIDVLVDMHGLSYWAERVEILRKEIKEML